MEVALDAFMTTKEGFSFISKFAKAGDVLAGHTFTEDGKYSNYLLIFKEISYSEENVNIIPSRRVGGYKVSKDKYGNPMVSIKAISLGKSMYDIVETLTHEICLHGFEVELELSGEIIKTDEGAADHTALVNKDMNHYGYRLYKRVREQLQRYVTSFGRVFTEAEK